MAAGGAVEVGRITVKVTPDTKGFARKLRQDLAKLRDNFNVDINPDTKGLREKVSTATKGMTAKVRVDADVDRLTENFKKKFDLLDLNFDRKVRDFFGVEKLQKEFDKLDLNWDKKLESFQRELRQSRVDLQPQVLKDRAEIVNMKVELDYSIAEAKLAAWKAKEANDKIMLDIEPDVHLGRFALARAKIKAIFAKPVDVEVTPSAGIAGRGNWMSKMLPSFGSGINPGGYALIAAGILTTLAPVVGIITTALLSLPGLVSLVAAPIAAVTLGLEGFKKAAEGIKPQFDGLRQTMADVAEQSFTPVLKNLADTIFPALERSLPSVTQGLARMAQGVVDTFNNPENMTKFEGSIVRIGQSLGNMTPGLQGFTSGLIGLIDQFSLKLPSITEWFNKTGQDFDAWVQKISSNGTLQTAFDNLGATIQKILGFLGELGSKSIDFMGNPGAIDGFLATLEKIGDAIQTVVDLSATLNKNWQMVVQAGRLLDGVGDTLQGDLAGAYNNFKDLATNAPWQGTKQATEDLKTSLSGVGPVAAEQKAALEQMFNTVPQQANQAVTATQDVIGTLQDQMTNTVAAPLPPPNTEPAKAAVTEYQGFVDSVTQQVRGALSQATSGESLPAPNFDAFKAAWSGMVSFVQQQVSAIQAVVNAMGSSISTSISGAISSCVGLWAQLSAAAIAEFGKITAAAAALPGQIQGALGSLAGIGQAAGKSLTDGLLAGLQGGMAGVVGYASTIAGQIAAVKGPLPKDRKELIPAGLALMDGLGVGLENGFQPVLDQAKGMAQQIADAFANGGDPTGFLDGYSKQDVKQMTSALGIQMKQLEMQAKALEYQASNAGGDKGLQDSLRNRAKEIRMQKDQIGLQNDMLKMTQDYNSELDNGNSLETELGKSVGKLAGAPVDFAKAVGGQFLSDLGIGGNGFISKLITEGTKYVFNVGSMDDAIAGMRVAQNREALGRSQR